MTNQKGFGLLYFIGAALIIALIGAAYYLGTQNNNSTTNNTQQELNNETSLDTKQEEKSTLTDSNKDTQTYLDSKYRYYFEFPASWTIVDNGEGSAQEKILTITSLNIDKPKPENLSEALVGFNVSKDKFLNQKIDLSTLVASRVKLYQIEPKEITIAGSKGYRFDVQVQKLLDTEVYFEHKGKVYYFIASVSEGEGKEEYIKLVEEIISSIKFND